MRELEEIREALRGRFFTAEVVRDAEEARARLLEWIPAGATVGVGGSVTVRELGVLEELESRGCRVLDHWRAAPEEVPEVRREQLRSDVFLTSANAITREGEIVLVDGVGNRVAATAFGPRIVVVVAGRNKVVDDLSGAWRRIEEIAAPKNASRLGRDLPCVKKESCQGCKSPQRICRIYLVVAFKPAQTDFRVLLVDEDLGF